MNPVNSSFANLIDQPILIMDGGTGTEFERRGLHLDSSLAWSANPNLSDPDMVSQIHQDYIRAGAQIIITNTFSANRATLNRDGLGEHTQTINQQAVKIALEARASFGADSSVLIAGSMSSAVPQNQTTVIPSYHAVLEVYKEQAQLLAEAGVDVIALEMFVRTTDAASAVEAATTTGLPIWVGLSCERANGQLYLGLRGRPSSETISDAVHGTMSNDVEAYFIMHSSPSDTTDALRELRSHTSLTLGAYAHSSDYQTWIGKQADESLGHHVDPTSYLNYAKKWVELGARIIGGCCGTTPEHIRVLSKGLMAH